MKVPRRISQFCELRYFNFCNLVRDEGTDLLTALSCISFECFKWWWSEVAMALLCWCSKLQIFAAHKQSSQTSSWFACWPGIQWVFLAKLKKLGSMWFAQQKPWQVNNQIDLHLLQHCLALILADIVLQTWQHTSAWPVNLISRHKLSYQESNVKRGENWIAKK